MTVTEAPVRTEFAPKRRLPIQVANEARMIAATIEILEVHPVEEITSRMIAEASGTATNYITRYFGGKDGLLVAVADELGHRISDLVRSDRSILGIGEPGNYVTRVMGIPEISLWFRLYRFLASRNLASGRTDGVKPPLVHAIEESISLIFGLEGEYVPICANAFLTYLMGNVAFGPFLGTTDQEAEATLIAMGEFATMLAQQSKQNALIGPVL